MNLTHLQRMKTDCKHMAWNIEQLKEQVKETMMIKFGSIIDVDELEEANLRQLVNNLRMSQIDIKSLYETEMQHWRVSIKLRMHYTVFMNETIKQK